MTTSAASAHVTPERQLTAARGFAITCVVFGLMAICVSAVYFGEVGNVPVRVSSETTHVIMPLTDNRRQVDYFSAAEQRVYPEELATEDNGYRMIVAALGVSPNSSPEERRQIYEKLGLDPNTPTTLSYTEPYDFLLQFFDAAEAAGEVTAGNDRQELENECFRLLGQAWTLDDLPIFEDWLNENGPALDLVAQAVRKPVFCVPWARSSDDVPLIALELNELPALRDFARGFATRARFRMATGDVDGAIDDIIACATLGRRLQQESLCDHLLGIACETLAYTIGLGLALDHQPTEEQWRRFLRELDSLPTAAPISAALESERLVCLDAVQSLALDRHIDHIDSLIGAGPAGRGDPNWSMVMRGFDKHEGIDLNGLLVGRDHGLDWNVVMQRVNERFDDLLKDPSAVPSVPSEMERVVSRTERSRLVGDQLFLQFQEAVADLRNARQRLDCKDNLQRIVVAMLLYEKQHGTLPPAYSVEEQGRPLNSWRVLLLPYLGYDELHSQIRLDEPWNSPHNQAFHMADVPIFQCPSAALGPGMTEYSVVEGETCAFFGGEGRRLDSFGEHSANLILVVERIDPICWMDPTREITFDEACLGINRDGARTGLGSDHQAGMHVGLRSGAIRFISQNIDRQHIPMLLEGTMHEPY